MLLSFEEIIIFSKSKGMSNRCLWWSISNKIIYLWL